MEEINVATQQDVIRWREGILYVQGEPVYIIRHILSEEAIADYVAVFDIDQEVYERSKGQRIIKKTNEVPTKRFNRSTKLGKLSDEFMNMKKRKSNPVYETAPALFVTSVKRDYPTLGKGDKMEAGFYEMTADRINPITNELESGDFTGVFISLDSVEWGEYQTSLTQLIRRASKNERVDFYDL